MHRDSIFGKLTNAAKKDKSEIKVIERALELGMTHIDTAEIYANGRSELIVGKAIEGFERKKLFITSKVYEHLDYKSVMSAIQGSLERIGTNYLDLYLIHWPTPNMDLKEAMKAFDDLIKEKLVRHIGVSNFSIEQLKEAQSHTKNKIITNQVKYNYMHRYPEKELLPYCQKNNILLTAYSPLQEGQATRNDLKIIVELMKKYNKTAPQIALNWLISQKNVITIPKSSKIEHVEENIGAIDFQITLEEIKKLNP